MAQTHHTMTADRGAVAHDHPAAQVVIVFMAAAAAGIALHRQLCSLAALLKLTAMAAAATLQHRQKVVTAWLLAAAVADQITMAAVAMVQAESSEYGVT